MDSHPETKVASSIDQYAGLLGIRKKWALRGIVAVGIVSVVSLVAAGAFVLALRDRAITATTALVVAILCIYPPIQLTIQVVEYRRLNGMLELLDVLERAASEGALESREK